MVLSCNDLLEELSAFVDGELEESRQGTLVEHLGKCAPCRQQKDGMSRLKGLLDKGQKQLEEQSPDIWMALAGRLPSICECVEDDLSAYLDGELIAPAKEGVSKHLEQCPQCLSKYHGVTKVNGLLTQGMQLPESVQVDIWSKIKTRLDDDCLLIKNDLSAFLDKEVATLRHRSVTHHLIECGHCTEEFESLAAVGDAIREHYQPEIPDSFDLWPQIKAKMNVIPLDSKIKGRRELTTKRLYIVAAGVIAGVLASIYMFVAVKEPSHVQPVTAEAYLIDSSLGEPADVAENVVYER